MHQLNTWKSLLKDKQVAGQVGRSSHLDSCLPQDKDKPEDEMAQKRASLLERQQRRAEEARKRKQWQEAEKEQRREEAVRWGRPGPAPGWGSLASVPGGGSRLVLTTRFWICRLVHDGAPVAPIAPASAPSAPVALMAAAAAPAPGPVPAPASRVPAEEEVGPRRGEFTRLEYERRAQLKLMDDLEKVLRPRAVGAGGPGRGGRRAPRPRSGCCDDSALARSPARGLLGEDHGWGSR